jgi:putative tricarboxylic transport membrane protein
MRRYGFPAPPAVLGVILGPIAEDVLGRALIISHGDWSVLFKAPIALFFYLVIQFAQVALSGASFLTHQRRVSGVRFQVSGRDTGL